MLLFGIVVGSILGAITGLIIQEGFPDHRDLSMMYVYRELPLLSAGNGSTLMKCPIL